MFPTPTPAHRHAPTDETAPESAAGDEPDDRTRIGGVEHIGGLVEAPTAMPPEQPERDFG